MKKLTKRYKRWLLHRAKNERRRSDCTFLRKPFRTGKWQRRLVNSMTPEERVEKFTPHILKHGQRIKPPQVFCLHENHDAVSAFMYKLREQTKNIVRGRPSQNRTSNILQVAKFTNYVDFRCIEKISTSAALVLAAEFDRLSKLTAQPLFPFLIDEWNQDVRKTLRSLGFLDLLGSEDNSHDSADAEQIVIQKFISGKKISTDKSDRIITAVNELSNVLSEYGEISLNTAVGEAMGNVVNHAYPEWHDFKFPMIHQWWLTGSADPATGRMIITIFDQGVTIPVHLPKHWREIFIDTLTPTPNSDGEMIRRATKLDRTSTSQGKRGKGFGDMKEAIDNSQWGRMRILSRYGEYIYEKDTEDQIFTHPQSIGGTLVEWEIGYPVK